MDKWKCPKCGNIIYIQPARNSKCDNCKTAKYQIIRTCKCGIEFHPERYTKLYCGKECGIKYQGKGGKKGKKYPHTQRARIGICKVCGKEYRAIKDFEGRKSKYCSKECWNNRVGGIGTIYIRNVDGKRNYIKTGTNTSKPLAIYLWEKENGKIPKGMVIHHINKKQLDDRIENLAMLTRKENLAIHRNDWAKENGREIGSGGLV